jgi:8-amino-7-oxononanoate synthase
MQNNMQNELNELKSKGLYRALRNVEGAQGATILIGGREYVNFSSNNYLGLAGHPDVISAAVEATKLWGAGASSSRLIAGTMAIHCNLEEELARFKNCEAALVFSSGYQANLGILSAVLKSGDCIIMDRLNHASLWDGAKLSGARIFAYAHNDMASLEKTLKRAKNYGKKLIVTDSLFSMDGDIAPLDLIVELAKRYNALTMIDEAHATGIFGANGSGLAGQFNLSAKIDIIMGTLSKAMGSQGAYVCGSKELVKYLINKSRSFIYSTALAPACAAAALKAIEIIITEPQRRVRVLEISKRLRDTLKSAGKSFANSQSQIVPMITGTAASAQQFATVLQEHGIFAPAIRPPTVQGDQCRVRFSLSAEHTDEHISLLTGLIKE